MIQDKRSVTTDITVVSAVINQDSAELNIYEPIRYKSFSFSILTDELAFYEGIMLNKDVYVRVDGNFVFRGKIIEIQTEQPYNFSQEVLSFEAVDELTLLKS